MTLATVATVVAIAALLPAAAAGRESSTNDQSCFMRPATIHGQRVTTNCGPATAKLRYKGKTYLFKSGTCYRTPVSVKLNLGTQLFDNSNGNGPYSALYLTMESDHAMDVEAMVGKLNMAWAAGYSGVGVKGTFKGIDAPISGSWSCGGPIRKL